MSTLITKENNGYRSYINFINSLKAEETKYQYKTCLVKYLSYLTLTLNPSLHQHRNSGKIDLSVLLDMSISDIENKLISYLMELKGQDLSHSYINLNFCAIKHFYIMNDVRINKEKIAKFIGESKKKHVGRGYEHEEIKTILDVCDLRFKVVVLILASTGMRRGALPELKLSNIEKKEDFSLYKFTIYENTQQEYITFCSTECATYIDQYLSYRTRSGEHLTPDSYLIREQFDADDIEQVRKHGRLISKKTLTNILHSLVIKSGLRTINHNYTGKDRGLIPLANGFRRFFTKQCVDSKLNPEIREMLLGHKIGLTSAYYKPSESEMLDEYMKAVDLLTINEENRLRKKVEKLEVDKNQFDRLAEQIRALEKKIR